MAYETVRMSSTLLQEWFPTTISPALLSAPMHGSANGEFTAEVSKAGGLGFLPGGLDLSPGSESLAHFDKQCTIVRQRLGLDDDLDAPLPIGVGYLTFIPSISFFQETALPLLQKHKPVAVWLFAPVPGSTTHRDIIEAVRDVGRSWNIKVLVQVGSVAAAREALHDGADAIIAQGVDAGGHQWAQGAGIISLVPEVRNLLRTEFPSRKVALVAAGGIAHGSSVTAALALGADGVVMGTRFLVADEATVPEHTRKAILGASDGGTSTIKSYLHDDMLNHSITWPKLYDGRAVVGPSVRDDEAGLPLAENISRLKQAQAAGDMSRNVYWAGSGVGLINERASAGDIVRKTRQEALESLRLLKGRISGE